MSADELAAAGAPVSVPEGGGGDPALIQYTSGSTGQPKGVLLTHDNLLANVRSIAAGLEMRPTDAGVSWLPLYHDMGLIGSWLTCLHQGLPLTLLSPTAFLARPERWLWAIHQRRATLSAAPNFAYELCARRIPDEALEGLDLSSWRCGPERSGACRPGHARALHPTLLAVRLPARGDDAGLRPRRVLGRALRPPVGRGPRVDRVARGPFQTEGRAEPATPDDATALEFVSAGIELAGHEVRIVDDAGAPVAERAVGRLVFRGPSMTAGYYRQPEATAAITLPGGWLDSGDLAYRAGGEIHVCGRRKDLIIKGGRNLVPQEIEEAAAAVEGIRRGCVVAFGVPNAALGTEGLVVVAETRVEGDAARDRLVGAVTERVAEAVDVPPGPGHPRAAGRGAEDLQRQGAPSGDGEQYLQGALGRPPRTTPAQTARLAASVLAEALRPGLERARRASTRRGFPSPCRCSFSPSGSSWCSSPAAASPSRCHGSRLGPASGSSAAVSRPRVSTGSLTTGPWYWPRTTPPTPTFSPSSPCCPPTSCSWPSARCSAIP